MPTLITAPSVIQAAGNKPKVIEEFNGGEWVQYSTPEPEGAEYIAVCIPAFSPNTVHRET